MNSKPQVDLSKYMRCVDDAILLTCLDCLHTLDKQRDPQTPKLHFGGQVRGTRRFRMSNLEMPDVHPFLVVEDNSEKKTMFLAFGGSATLDDTLAALDAFRAQVDSKTKSEVSAQDWYMDRAKKIPRSFFVARLKQGWRLVVTGHALGGAVAILFTYLLLKDPRLGNNLHEILSTRSSQKKLNCITFGAPLVGDETRTNQLSEAEHAVFQAFVESNDIWALICSVASFSTLESALTRIAGVWANSGPSAGVQPGADLKLAPLNEPFGRFHFFSASGGQLETLANLRQVKERWVIPEKVSMDRLLHYQAYENVVRSFFSESGGGDALFNWTPDYDRDLMQPIIHERVFHTDGLRGLLTLQGDHLDCIRSITLLNESAVGRIKQQTGQTITVVFYLKDPGLDSAEVRLDSVFAELFFFHSIQKTPTSTLHKERMMSLPVVSLLKIAFARGLFLTDNAGELSEQQPARGPFSVLCQMDDGLAAQRKHAAQVRKEEKERQEVHSVIARFYAECFTEGISHNEDVEDLAGLIREIARLEKDADQDKQEVGKRLDETLCRLGLRQNEPEDEKEKEKELDRPELIKAFPQLQGAYPKCVQAYKTRNHGELSRILGRATVNLYQIFHDLIYLSSQLPRSKRTKRWLYKAEKFALYAGLAAASVLAGAGIVATGGTATLLLLAAAGLVGTGNLGVAFLLSSSMAWKFEKTWEALITDVGTSFFGEENVRERQELEKRIAEVQLDDVKELSDEAAWERAFRFPPFQVLSLEGKRMVLQMVKYIREVYCLRESLLPTFELAVVGQQNAGKSRFLFELCGQTRVLFGQETNTRFPLIFSIADDFLATDYPGFQDKGNFSKQMLHFGIPASSAVLVLLSLRDANAAENIELLSLVENMSSCPYLVCLNKVDEFFRTQLEQLARKNAAPTKSASTFAARLKQKVPTNDYESSRSVNEEWNTEPFEAEALDILVDRFMVLLGELDAEVRLRGRFWMTTLSSDAHLVRRMQILLTQRGRRDTDLPYAEIQIHGQKDIEEWVISQYQAQQELNL